MEQIGEFAGLERDETLLRYAESVLRPARPRSPVALAPVIERTFLDTMRELGYGGLI
jgi:hypothetical protein